MIVWLHYQYKSNLSNLFYAWKPLREVPCVTASDLIFTIRGWKRNNWISLIHYSIYFFLSYSLFFIQFCSIFIVLFRVCRATLVASTLQFHQLSLASPTLCSPKIDQSMFTVETVVSQTELFFLSYEKKYRFCASFMVSMTYNTGLINVCSLNLTW